MINVVGLGYIGLPTALMFAAHGVEVTGTDYNRTLVDTLNAGKTTFEEDGLDELFRKAVAGGIRFSHEYERRLARAIANPGARAVDVLSLTRLAVRVFAEAGGLAETVLTPAGRLLTLREAVRRVHTSLEACAGALERPELLRETLTAIDEFKTCYVAPEDLLRAASDAGAGAALSKKLKEQCSIYSN